MFFCVSPVEVCGVASFGLARLESNLTGAHLAHGSLKHGHDITET